MIVVFSLLAMLALFGLSIFVHELGHFLAARSLGMAADVFSIGMGKGIWKRKIGDTVWQIGWMPFGGYVMLPQMDPNSFLEGPPGDGAGEGRKLPRVEPWKKIVVSVAGALGNVAFAFVLATAVWALGKPSSLQERNAVVGYVEDGSPAAEAGLVAGDEVLAIGGEPVKSWVEMSEKAALAPGDSVKLTVRTAAGEEREVELELERAEVGIRLLPGLDGMEPCHVAAVNPGSGAEAAGLRGGDQILGFDGQKVYGRAHLSQLVERAAGRAAAIEYRRDGQVRTTPIESRWDEKRKRHLVGIQFNTIGDLDFETRAHPTPWAQVGSHATAIFRFLRALATPSTSGAAADAVGGPVLILIMLWLMVKSSFMLAIWFTGFLNVNLAIFNLLPLPILDGGHVVMSAYEWARGRPPPPRLVNALANTFAALFIALFLTLTFRDSVRHVVPSMRQWAEGGGEAPPAPAQPVSGAEEVAEPQAGP